MQSLSASVAQGLGFGTGSAIAHEAVRAATGSERARSHSQVPAAPIAGSPADTDDVAEQACDAALRAYSACVRNSVERQSAAQCDDLGKPVSGCLERFPHLQA